MAGFISFGKWGGSNDLDQALSALRMCHGMNYVCTECLKLLFCIMKNIGVRLVHITDVLVN